MATPAAEQIEHLEVAARVAGLAGVEIVAPDEHDDVFGSLRLHWVDWGTAGRRPVLFLHGGLLTARTWDLVCLALRGDWHRLALDQRGHGDSEWSAGLDYDTDAHVSDLEAFVTRVGLERPVLVGQSMGALNALAYAHRHAAELRGLVLVDIAHEVELSGTARIAEFASAPAELDSIDEFVARAVAFNPARDERLLRRSLLHNLRRLPNGRWTWKYDRRAISAGAFDRVRARLESFTADVAAVTCPTLVVRGEQSDVVTPAAVEAFAAAFPHARATTIPAAGHTVQGDNPRALADALREFLETVG
jgi:pimeloyl-ACP methyl ester carboxylesterase